ncbi:defensin [Contarinia nasturtii]|uniref:defensin n=1 Tax=Contarinia nasturtii TaxID=265458 RepID=UPI0012D38794|nr:defensin [Contarinia nasturtii]
MNFKGFAIFVAFVAIVSCGLADPQEEEAIKTHSRGINQAKEPFVLPETRITCDIMGSDAYCAALCIIKGFKGGYCNSQKVCVCRN